MAAVTSWRECRDRQGEVSSAEKAAAVRFLLEELGARAPGRSVEVRVPPYGAVQCLPGVRHTRGTPPTVVEADVETWLELATGLVSWAEAVSSGRLRVSGLRADLEAHFPLVAGSSLPELS